MSQIEERAERVLALTQRLTEALLGDLAALDRGRPNEMRSILPETQQLLSQYAREAAAVKKNAKMLSTGTRSKLTAVTTKLHDALARHERRLTCLRNASEGMIRAIVDDVERKKRVTRPYGPRPGIRAPGAMLYNGLA
jgi:chemotaxis protein histidine kinase CheA